ncbi:hypothetical protein [Blastomonas aquatica]|uniref:Uncharacterized protein n=1 Tax=Blastomonas aquatica TaxID=1510276 RepID=A0ABQ1IUW6_9SPHN|nr:hypothetical protein [Blastomonas aquatica]GGB51146.1 hypothetical protein GCM10010833_02360 [Blastomonas aquatica]
MKSRHICSLLVAAGLIHAPLASADARMIAVSNCNGGTSLLVIPEGDQTAGKSSGNDCAKACHGMSERRGKSGAKRADCAR